MIGRLDARMRNEDGVALVLALAFLSLFGLWISSLLTLAAASAKSTVQLRSVASDEYEAYASVQQAITYMRPNLEMGRSGQRTWQCGSVTNTGATAVSKSTCVAGSGGTITSNGTDNPSNHPARAILALGNNGSENEIDHNSSTALSVHGAVYAAGNLTNNASPAMNVEGDVTAQGACAGTVLSIMPPTHCSDATTVADPAYLGAVTPSVGRAPPSVCPSSAPTWLVQFQPGHYDDATQMNALMSGTCTNRVFYFNPGTYYFDFQNSGTHIWTINDSTANVVAGQPSSWTTADLSKASPFPFPGGCKTNMGGATDGVQFVFGGDSQLQLLSGKFEACPIPSAGGQQIAVYGLRTSSTSTIGPNLWNGTAESHTGAGTWSSTSNAFLEDGANASVSSNNNNELDTITLSTFNTFNVPSTATITQASVYFTHTDSSTNDVTMVTVTPGGAAPCSALNGTESTTSHRDGTAGNATACLNTPAKVNGLSAKYSITFDKKNKTALLDGVVVDVTYSVTINALSGCVTTTGYPASGCAMLKTTGGSLAVQGTVYAPNAALDITLTSVNYTVFARGIIARMFKSAIASSDVTKDQIVVPDDCPYSSSGASNLTSCSTGTRTDRVVTVYAGVGVGTCDASPTGCKVVAQVVFQDGTATSGTCSSPGAQTTVTAGRQVTICEWSVNR